MTYFDELIENRYSLRSYSEKEVEDEILKQILEATLKAPTAKNKQAQRLFIFKSAEARERLKKYTPCHFNAPIVILGCYDENEEFVNEEHNEIHSGQQDVSIVFTHLMLKAAELGLGTCWVNLYDGKGIAQEFNLPANIIPVALMPLGYPSESAKPAGLHYKSKEVKDVVTYL